MDQQSRGRLDPLADARDFLYQPRPRVRPISPARKLQQIERMAREAVTTAQISGGGGSGSSVPIFDTLPDATPEDVGSIIYVAGASGQPAQGYIGVQTQNDTVIWEPIFTQAFYGAATEFVDELWSVSNWVPFGGTASSADGGVEHPGTQELETGSVSGNRSQIELQGVYLGNVSKAAFIFQTPATTSSIIMRVGIMTPPEGPNNGVYVEKQAETNWRFAKAIGGVETRVDSGLSGLVASNWWLFQVEDTFTSGSFILTLTDLTGAQGSSATTVTGLNEVTILNAGFLVETATNAIRRMRADYFFLRNHATVRS